MEKFTPEQLKSMLTDEARAALPPNVEFGQTEDGKMTINGEVVSYAQLKQRDDDWYEERAEFWKESIDRTGSKFSKCSLRDFDLTSIEAWRGCFIKNRAMAIIFSPEREDPFTANERNRYNSIYGVEFVSGETGPQFNEVVDCIKRLFSGQIERYPNGTDNFRVEGDQSRDIREAIDARGPWDDDKVKVGADDDSACVGPKGEPGVPGIPKAVETVKPETIDAIVAMYEDRLSAERIQNDIGAQENRRLIEAQAAQIQDLTARMQRIRDVLDGKPEPDAYARQSSDDPVEHAIDSGNDPFSHHDACVVDVGGSGRQEMGRRDPANGEWIAISEFFRRYPEKKSPATPFQVAYQIPVNTAFAIHTQNHGR